MDSDQRSSEETARQASDPKTIESDLPEILEVFGSEPLVHEVVRDRDLADEDLAPTATIDDDDDDDVDVDDDVEQHNLDLDADDLDAIAVELEAETQRSASESADDDDDTGSHDVAPDRAEVVRGANGPGFAGPGETTTPLGASAVDDEASARPDADASSDGTSDGASDGMSGFFGSTDSDGGSSTATRSAPTPAQPAASASTPGNSQTPTPSEERLVLLLDQMYRGMDAGLANVRDLVQLQDSRVSRLEQSVEEVAKQVGFVPGKLRGLSSKLAEVASVASDARCRELVTEIFALDDMLQSACAGFPRKPRSKIGKEARRYFDSFSVRLGQVLEGQGVMPIPSEGAFDAKLHQAVESRPVSDPDQHGIVVEVFRSGWRTEHSVLRYSEVAVGRFDPDAPDDPDDGPDSGSKKRSSRSRKARAGRHHDDAHDDDAHDDGAHDDDIHDDDIHDDDTDDFNEDSSASLDEDAIAGDFASDRTPSISLRTGER